VCTSSHVYVHIIGVRLDVSGGKSFDPIDIIEPAILMKFDLSICGLFLAILCRMC